MPRPGFREVVLLTGFPALQARKLLQLVLCSEPDTFIYAVVMKRLAPDADRARAALPSEQRRRVDVLDGDAAALDMGLSGRELRAIGREIDRIHHVAHVNYVGVDRERAKLANVRAAVEAVELGRQCPGLRCLLHHSTASVCGDREGIATEAELDVGQRFQSVIQETRAKGEKVMRRAMRDLPIAVVRPTTVVGDSGTGESDHFDGPYLLVMLILGLPKEMAVPLPKPGDTPVNIVPVDFVVKAAQAISRHPDAPGKTFHLASRERLTAEQLFELVAKAGGHRTVRSYIPTHLARAVLRTPGVDRLLQKPLELLHQLAQPVAFDTRNADAILAGLGIECPPFRSYVDTLVSAVQEHLRDKRRELQAVLDTQQQEDPLA
jgi:thioester reductase-like protein